MLNIKNIAAVTAVLLISIDAAVAQAVGYSTGGDKSIDVKFRAHGKKFFGCASDQSRLTVGSTGDIIKANFGQLTPENSMKWDSLQGTQGQFDTAGADFLVDWAVANKKLVRGHALVWHIQLPEWVSDMNDAKTLTTVLQTHISTVVGRWAGKIYAWDVANEIFNEDGTVRTTTVWGKVLGDNLMPIAFEAAKAADPNAKLYINDYNMDKSDSPKAIALAARVKEWLAAGIPIDGIGTQAHLSAGTGSQVAGALQVLASSGVSEISITELDIIGAAPDDYVAVTQACLDEPKCVGITVWGVRDTDSWRPGNTPLLFDEKWLPKPAYDAILGIL
ncbi:uncharacterized protein L3040_004398 [Drepanopeziza brunnea f. sp. 'multigermtubi']|uniref:Beta-xylanase n=1 Tax=Marssonina brunnea f. sp. multigermtubi (strain MB_m1) TaxID=1072389 RepID=K1WXU3_MARBU|nr:putative Endo-1,4-beta-xylanase C [Drepanopeziza brunnea f. sp. 'multigermtubi' MB_m1]EKD17861.1 putative Endo-1,4-beta-xylanase C [Drepanopeziza brunnea f. sp. 'multigermtubi' MB_m1]KAJ5043009.1 hypothetical protein L3040_004398 [Drepanopeziza brunnea f. sp. 'multigermtubi']